MLSILNKSNFLFFLPEYFLGLAILCLILFVSIIMKLESEWHAKRVGLALIPTCMFVVFCTLLILSSIEVTNVLFYDTQFIFDYLARFMQVFLLILVFLFFSFSRDNLLIIFYKKAEYMLLFLGALLGALFLVCSNDLLAIYLNIELMSLAFYCLAAARKKSVASTEAGVKYFLLGSFSSVFLLLGIVLLYGTYGTVNLSELHLLLLDQQSDDELFPLLEKAYLLISLAFFFKVSAAPFHFWSPDVYEGAPSSSTLFFSLIPKLAYFPAFLRILAGPAMVVFTKISYLFFAIGVFSILVGSFLAIQQKTVKRILAFSSISHVGYMFLALGTNSIEGVQVAFFYLLVYVLTTVGVWLTVFFIYTTCRLQERPLKITDYVLASKAYPSLRWGSLVFFFSLMGLPPFAGFLAKAFVVWSAFGSFAIVPCILALLISVVSSFYYLRLIKIAFEELSELERINKWYYNFMTDLTVYPTGATYYMHWLLCFFIILMVLIFFDPSNLLICCELMAICLF